MGKLGKLGTGEIGDGGKLGTFLISPYPESA